MLIEIIIYIALFATLFSGAFLATFQSMDAIQYLEHKKDMLDAKYFLQAKLDKWMGVSSNWAVLPDGRFSFDESTDGAAKSFVLLLENSRLIISDDNAGFKEIISGNELSVGSFAAEVIDTSTSTYKVLNLNIDINNTPCVFSYYAEK